MNSINILDVTLRDGGYINNWEFDNFHISNNIEELTKANLDIIECGFLDQKDGKVKDSTRFNNINVVNEILEKNQNALSRKALYVVMVEAGKYDLNTLPVYNKNKISISGIRYSFRKSNYKNIFEDLKRIVAGGYKAFVQPISTNSYSEQEISELIAQLNLLEVYAVYIVDTQGVMFNDDFKRLYRFFDREIKKGVKIGFHSHNNMQLSYSIAIDFIEIAKERDIIIDSSVYGMGRGAGNLNTELLADYINRKIIYKYDTAHILDLIDKYYYALYKKSSWGYSLAHFLSASIGCHPDYATFLINKKKISVVGIKEILAKISQKDTYEYNKNLIEKFYYQYNAEIKHAIKEPFFKKESSFLVVASGASVKEKAEFISKNREQYDYIVSMNHIPEHIDVDYCFLSGQKRFNEFNGKIDNNKMIVSSNVLQDDAKYVLDYERLIDLGETKNDNSTIMFINYLFSLGVDKVTIAGLDGYELRNNNYSYDEYDAVVDKKAIAELNEYILQGLRALSKKIKIEFLTESIFKRQLKQRIICVIPARASSTRLPGKPLKDICGMPMVAHVLKRAQMTPILDEIYVATDSQEIKAVVELYGGRAILTSKDHANGTMRMQEVSTSVTGDIFVLLNGDEPLVEPEHIEASVKGLLQSDGAVASILVHQYKERNNPTKFKVVMNLKNEVVYISRNDIPSDARGVLKAMWKAYHIVSYTKDFLDLYANKLSETELEVREMHEDLRILEYGYKIQGVVVESDSMSVDTMEDLETVRKIMVNNKLFEKYKKTS